MLALVRGFHRASFLSALALPTRDQLTRWDRAAAILLFLLASCIFLFVDPKTSPVALQDEARNSINAIEMYLRGFSLVTTFNFQPDLWNTKPPLLIWLMSGSMSLFGPSEWAIRLPSAVAALGILLCTLLFVRRTTGSLGVALVAATLLVLSPGFFGEHGARTADYDATLTFFVTAGLQLTFFAVHRARPSVRSMFVIGGLIAAAALTKSIAAFIPVTGVALYLVVVKRLRRVVSLSHLFAVAAATSLAPLSIFYALREAAAPNYLSSVLYNDMAGRFSETLIWPTSPFYYITELSFGWFVAGPFLIAAPLVLRRESGRTRLVFLYAASIVSLSLAVYSAAANRAVQYALPMFPWLSIIAALTLRHLAGFVAEHWRQGKKGISLALGLTMALVGGQLVYRAAEWRYHLFPQRDFYPQSSYGDLFAELSAKGVKTLIVVDPGHTHLGKRGYAPLLRWNRLVWAEKGLQVAHELTQPATARVPVASCQPSVVARWSGPPFERIGSCGVLWQTRLEGTAARR